MKVHYVTPCVNLVFTYEDVIATSPKDVDTTMFNPSWLDLFFEGGAN